MGNRLAKIGLRKNPLSDKFKEKQKAITDIARRTHSDIAPKITYDPFTEKYKRCKVCHEFRDLIYYKKRLSKKTKQFYRVDTCAMCYQSRIRMRYLSRVLKARGVLLDTDTLAESQIVVDMFMILYHVSTHSPISIPVLYKEMKYQNKSSATKIEKDFFIETLHQAVKAGIIESDEYKILRLSSSLEQPCNLFLYTFCKDTLGIK